MSKPVPVLAGALEKAVTAPEDDDPFGPIARTVKAALPEPVLVTDYDAKGEAVDHDAAAFSAPELPGMPEPAEPLWPRMDGHRVGKVQLAFTGQVTLEANQLELAHALEAGNSVNLTIECNVDAKRFVLMRKKGHAQGLVGVAVLKVTYAALVEEF